MKIKKILGKRVLIGDGSMGALLQQEVAGSFVPDELNLSKPGLIEKVHYEYASAGASFISTNTFGASRLKLRDVGLEKQFKEINIAGTQIARRVADFKDIWVAGDIGPSGVMMEPLGDTTFDEMRDNYAEQAHILEKHGADFIILETITDIQQFRAALVGILSAVKIPVLATMSFTNDELALSGTDGATFAVTSGFPGVRAVGSNCGTTLESMLRVMQSMAAYSHLPLICQPNAGIPVMENGKPVFKVTPDTFTDFMEEIYNLGASVLGGCCGTTPEYIARLAERLKNHDVIEREVPDQLILSSRTAIREISPRKLFMVGERINPTGRKKLRKELETGKFTTIRQDAREQEKHGADALDINVSLHKINMDIVREIVKSVQNLVQIPLVIDSMDPLVIEEFAKIYGGKGIINSISGEKSSLKTLLPLVRKYNMAFIGVLIDEDGISDSAKKRLKIAKKIIKWTKKHDIPTRNIIFDPLVLSAGAEIDKVAVTLETLDLLKKEYPHNKTIMGVSNISFGLPNRELVNSSYLTMAATHGLDMAILNPLHQTVRDQLLALDFLRTGSKENLARYTDYFTGFTAPAEERKQRGKTTLLDDILHGDLDNAGENIKTILETEEPVNVIGRHIMPAMNEVGRRYQHKECFLPQLIASADVVKAILPLIKEKLPKTGDNAAAPIKVVFASVKGDVHDIGKNIVISILESFNIDVIDLGKDIPAETVVSEAIRNNADAIGLSALMTTTLPAMTETVKAIRDSNKLKHVRTFIGGAVVTQSIADDLGAQYAADGMIMANKLLSTN